MLLGGPAGPHGRRSVQPAVSRRHRRAGGARGRAARRGSAAADVVSLATSSGVFDKAEPGRAGVRDLRRWVWCDVPSGSTIDRPRCARHALAAFLRERYEGSIAALNAAWKSDVLRISRRSSMSAHDRCRGRARLQRRAAQTDLAAVRPRSPAARMGSGDHAPRARRRSQSSDRLTAAGDRERRASTASGAAATDPNPDRWVDPPATSSVPTARRFATARSTCSVATATPASISSPSTPTPGARRFPRPGSPTALHGSDGNRASRSSSASSASARASTAGRTAAAPRAFVPHHGPVRRPTTARPALPAQIEQFIGFRDVVGAVWHAWSDRFIADRSRPCRSTSDSSNAPTHPAA